jgi:adenosylmethionine-8-amino-7-oxononanoate aminotransferase
MTRFWHPMSNMKQVAGNELVFDRGEGPWVYDTDGKRYLDAAGSLWYANVGHGRQELADAAAAQLARLEAYSAYDVFTTKPALELADRLSALAPIDDAVVFYTTAGSDAVESAVKLARRYWTAVGRPEKQVVVGREKAYHGVSGYGLSLGGIPVNAEGFGPLAPAIEHVPYDDVDVVARLFEERAGEIAAFMGEPVIGAGGVYPPPDGYWPAIERLCRKHDVLLAVDEVITGFGRLGEWFGSKRYGIEPDLFTFAKGVTSGYVPLGGVVVGPRVQEPFWRGDAGMFRHGYTYSGHATACAVALANLDIIEREGLVQRVKELEPTFIEKLRSVEGAVEVRAAGLVAGVQVDEVERVVLRLRELGVLTRIVGGHSLQICPPFVIGEEELDLLADSLNEAVGDVALKSG